MKRVTNSALLSLATLLSAVLLALAADKETKTPQVYPVALLPFQERGRDTKDEGSKVTDLLFAQLAAEPSLLLVDRADIAKLLAEQEVSLSGLVNPQQATKVGQLTGAKLLITGSVLQVDNTVYLIAKIIGTETSRVVGASVKGNVRDDLGTLVAELAKEITKTVAQRADDLVAKPLSREDRIAVLKKKLGGGKRPAVSVHIAERHVAAIVLIDPAAETEVAMFCKETGFKLIDPKEGLKKAIDVRIEGEAISEMATRIGNLISVKARLEVKAIDEATGQIVAVDRQTTVAVDLTEQIAAKTALQEAGAELAERLLPKIVAEAKVK
jgi:TolB-like protein